MKDLQEIKYLLLRQEIKNELSGRITAFFTLSWVFACIFIFVFILSKLFFVDIPYSGIKIAENIIIPSGQIDFIGYSLFSMAIFCALVVSVLRHFIRKDLKELEKWRNDTEEGKIAILKMNYPRIESFLK